MRASSLTDRFGQFFYSKWQLVRVAHVLAILTILGESYMMDTYFPDYWDSLPLRYVSMSAMVLAFVLSFWSQRDRIEWVFILCYETVQLAVLSTLFHNEISIRIALQVLIILVMIGALIEVKWLLWSHYLLTLVAVMGVISFMDAPVKEKAIFLEVFAIIWAISIWGTFWIRKSRERLRELIDEKSLALDNLARAKTLLEKSQSIAHVGSWEVVFPGMQLSWSPETYEIIEADPNAPIDTERGMSLLSPTDQQLVRQAMQQAGKEGKPFDLQMELTTFKGNKKYIRAMGYGEQRNGKLSRLYGVLQDITQYRENELLLLKAKDEAEQAQREAEKASLAKSQFLSVMSHEIRTPMNAVIGISHLLLQEDPRPEQVENLETLHFSAENLLSLINDILDFSKIEAGKVELEKIGFSLPKMLRSIIQASTYKAQEKGITLTLEAGEDLPNWIEGDPTRLTQVLNNLLSNAIKFTEQGGVCLQVHRLSQQADEVVMRFVVQDTGIGIPTDKLKVIFEGFTQANTDTTRKYGGTGLGLAITRKLLQLHGSDVEVSSTVGEGTTFSFELKAKLVERPPVGAGIHVDTDMKRAQPPSELEERAGRILLVEDNLINIKVASKFLTKWGYEVEVAQNGRIGVDKVSSESFDCILMDLQMPEVDGFQATAEIRSFNPEIPIIALTAEATGDIRQKVIDAGMNDYSTKPFIPRELRQKIAQYVKPQVVH